MYFELIFTKHIIELIFDQLELISHVSERSEQLRKLQAISIVNLGECLIHLDSYLVVEEVNGVELCEEQITQFEVLFEGFIVDGKFRRFFEQSEDEQVPEVYHIVECSVEVLEDELSNLVLVIYVRIDQVSPLSEIKFEKCVFLLGDAVEII